MPRRYKNRYGASDTNPQRNLSTRTKPLKRRPMGMAISKKKARNVKDVNKKLTTLRTAVKKLQAKSYGELQLDAQAFYHRGDDSHTADIPYVYTLCAEQPLCFCPQAIRRGAALWQLQYDSTALPGVRFQTTQVGAFSKQKFALTELNEDPALQNDLKYDTKLYWENAQGVQPKYLLKSSTYEFEVQVAGVIGYVELVACSLRRNFVQHTATNYQFPGTMRGYINTCKGTRDCNHVAQNIVKTRVLKRMYFQYPHQSSGGTLSERVKYFGPLAQIMRLKLKHNNVIAVAVLEPSIGSGTAAGNANQVIDYTEIPLDQQTWLMFRTSVPQVSIRGAQVPGSDPPIYGHDGTDPTRRISCQFRRVVSWRDWLGNSIS